MVFLKSFFSLNIIIFEIKKRSSPSNAISLQFRGIIERGILQVVSFQKNIIYKFAESLAFSFSKFSFPCRIQASKFHKYRRMRVNLR